MPDPQPKRVNKNQQRDFAATELRILIADSVALSLGQVIGPDDMALTRRCTGGAAGNEQATPLR